MAQAAAAALEQAATAAAAPVLVLAELAARRPGWREAAALFESVAPALATQVREAQRFVRPLGWCLCSCVDVCGCR